MVSHGVEASFRLGLGNRSSTDVFSDQANLADLYSALVQCFGIILLGFSSAL